MNRVEVKSVVEIVFVTFDFTASLVAGETLTGTPAVTCIVYLGRDPAPQSMLSGTATKNAGNTIVTQKVQGGIAVTDYKLEASCTTSAGRTLSSIAILPVR